MDDSKNIQNFNCQQHGVYASEVINGIRVRRCPQCVADEEALEAEKQRRRLIDLRREAGITERYTHATLENFVAETDAQRFALQSARDFVAAVLADPSTARSMIFAGGPGTGKSHLACAIVAALVPHRTVCRRRASHIIRKLRETWRRDAELTEDDVIHHYSSQHLLILEELGAGFGTDAERSQLFEILDNRYELRLPTLLTTNITSVSNISAELGERAVDRLRDGGGIIVPFLWQSCRGVE